MRVKLLAVDRRSNSSFCRCYIVEVLSALSASLHGSVFVCAEHLSMLQELLARAYKWCLTAAAICLMLAIYREAITSSNFVCIFGSFWRDKHIQLIQYGAVINNVRRAI